MCPTFACWINHPIFMDGHNDYFYRFTWLSLITKSSCNTKQTWNTDIYRKDGFGLTTKCQVPIPHLVTCEVPLQKLLTLL